MGVVSVLRHRPLRRLEMEDVGRGRRRLGQSRGGPAVLGIGVRRLGSGSGQSRFSVYFVTAEHMCLRALLGQEPLCGHAHCAIDDLHGLVARLRLSRAATLARSGCRVSLEGLQGSIVGQAVGQFAKRVEPLSLICPPRLSGDGECVGLLLGGHPLHGQCGVEVHVGHGASVLGVAGLGSVFRGGGWEGGALPLGRRAGGGRLLFQRGAFVPMPAASALCSAHWLSRAPLLCVPDVWGGAP